MPDLEEAFIAWLDAFKAVWDCPKGTPEREVLEAECELARRAFLDRRCLDA